MAFSNLESDAGLQSLDSFLVDKSYIEGFTPSQADVAVFEAVKKAPAAKFVNALRWYNHIASFKIAETKLFPGQKKAASEYGPGAASKPASPAKPAAAAVKPAAKPAPAKEEEDDDLDLFGSDDEEDEANEKLKAQRVAEYNAKKAAKPKTTAKSMIVLDVKPWDDETDMEALKKNVLAIEKEGLVWGTSKFVPVGYGIKKFSVTCVVVDDLVGVDDLIEQITADEDHVQSVDVASFNKL